MLSAGLLLTSEQPVEKYYLNTRKFFKIWFSKDPKSFLGLENELRLIHERVTNPHADITLVYSSKCLSEVAQKNLFAFCKLHNIKPFDFDTELEKLLVHDQDKVLFQIVQLELAHARDNTGGNLAVASDCARLIVPVLVQGGGYSDCDNKIDFSNEKAMVEVNAPVIFSAQPRMINSKYIPVRMTTNNDFIAPTVDAKDPDKLSDQALDHIRKLQSVVIEGHTRPYYSMLERTSPLIDPRIKKSPNKAIISHCAAKKMDIFQFRKFCQMLTIDDYNQFLHDDISLEGLLAATLLDEVEQPKDQKSSDQILKPLKHELLLASESNTTGPGCVGVYLNRYFGPQKECTEKKPWEDFYALVKRHDLVENGIEHCCKGQDAVLMNSAHTTGAESFALIGSFCDLSWTEEGAKNKQKREEHMLAKGKTILRYWKKHKDQYLKNKQSMSLQMAVKGKNSKNTESTESTELKKPAKLGS